MTKRKDTSTSSEKFRVEVQNSKFTLHLTLLQSSNNTPDNVHTDQAVKNRT